MQYIALYDWLKFQTIFTTCGELMAKKRYRSSPKPGNTESVISIFNNVKITKNIQRWHVSNEQTTIY